MKGRAFIGALLLIPGLAAAQTSPSAANQAWNWMQGEWKVVQQQGRVAAERVVRAYPQRFKSIKGQVARVTEVAGQFADTHRLAEKKELLLELWEVRGSLDILALCSPDVIHQLTGLDTAAVASMETQVNRMYRKVGG